ERIPRSVLRKLEEVRALSREKGNTNTISLEPEIGSDEFEDDEAVAICILTEPERQMKEIVWVTANADWLRQEHAKKIKRELKIAEITAMGGDPSLLDKPKARKDGKLIRKDGLQRSGRGGDTSYLRDDDRRRRQESIAQEGGDAEGNGGDAEGGEEEDGSRTRSPSGSPFPVMRSTADTVHLFMQQRSNAFSSRRLNRDAIEQTARALRATPEVRRRPGKAAACAMKMSSLAVSVRRTLG
ncbi:MAG: transcription factor TFIIIB subunit brf1, partial [Watsoniomyces obsoletus]